MALWILSIYSGCLDQQGRYEMKTDNSKKPGSEQQDNNVRAAESEWQLVSLDVLREKYAKGEEQQLSGPEMVRAIRSRVARALSEQEAQPDAHAPVFLKALEQGFIPGGRINSAAGTNIENVTLINCFVQPVGDSISSTVNG